MPNDVAVGERLAAQDDRLDRLGRRMSKPRCERGSCERWGAVKDSRGDRDGHCQLPGGTSLPPILDLFSELPRHWRVNTAAFSRCGGHIGVNCPEGYFMAFVAIFITARGEQCLDVDSTVWPLTLRPIRTRTPAPCEQVG